VRSSGGSGAGARAWARRVPNAISIFRGLLALPILYYTVSAGEHDWIVALSLLGLAALSDALDGWLARRLDAQSELGRILDPLADKVVVGGVAAALWAGNRIPGWLAAAIIGRDAAILVLAFLMRRRLGHMPKANVVGKIAVGVLVFTLAAYLARADRVAGALKWIAAGALTASAVSYGHRLVRMLRGPTRENPSGVRP